MTRLKIEPASGVSAGEPMTLRSRLIVCLEGGTQAGWNAVLEELHEPVLRTLARHSYVQGTGAGGDLDDLFQDFFLHLCKDRDRVLPAIKKLRDAEVLPYMRAMAANLAHDRHRRRQAGKRGSGVTGVDLGSNVAAVDGRDGERRLLGRAVEDCLRQHKIVGEQYRAFWYYYRDGYTAEEISRWVAQLSTKGVESLLLRLRKIVKDCIAGKKSKRLNEGKEAQTALTEKEWGNG